MVHSGGFYVVERRKTPDLVSRTLHWFRWEAGITWLSGFALLVLIYYLGGGALVDPDVRDISVGAAVALGIGIIVACGFVYDVMMASPLGRHEKLFAAISYVLIVAVSYVLTSFFSGRGGLHPSRRDLRHDHGRERLDAHPAVAEKNDRRTQRRAQA